VTNGAITKEAGDFLTRHIDSVAHLELLLLLYGDKDREWSADGIARELRVERGWAVARLKEFAASGIARASAGGDRLLRRSAGGVSADPVGDRRQEPPRGLIVAENPTLTNRCEESPH
jgi:hypothetical protein